MIVRVGDDKGWARGTLAGQVEHTASNGRPRGDGGDENWKTALSTRSLPLWDTFVSGHRPLTINFTYLPLSRLSPALKLKITSIVIALRAHASTRPLTLSLFLSVFSMQSKLSFSFSDALW